MQKGFCAATIKWKTYQPINESIDCLVNQLLINYVFIVLKHSMFVVKTGVKYN